MTIHATFRAHGTQPTFDNFSVGECPDCGDCAVELGGKLWIRR